MSLASAAPQLVEVVNPIEPAAVTDPIAVSAFYEQSTQLVFVELHNVSDRAVDVSGWQLCLKTQGMVEDEEVRVPFPAQGYMLADSYASFVDKSITGLDSFTLDSMTLGLTSTNKLRYIALRDAETNLRHTTVVDNTVSGFTTKWWSRESSGFSGFFNLDFTGHTSDAIINHMPLYELPELEEAFRIVEVFSRAQNCSPYEDENEDRRLCHDYIKLYIPESQKRADAFVVRTDSSSSQSTVANTFSIPSNQEGYVTIRLRDDGLPIEINNSGYVWLEDMTGTIHSPAVDYTIGETELGSWALGDDAVTWLWTTTPQPSGANSITLPVEEVVTCPAGKYLNPDTGRCRTLEEAVNALAACPEGQERNPVTNRCRAKVTASAATLIPCGEGQERNPATNRCRSIASAVAELMPCDEGYERNPATNRCRKVAGVSTTAATSNELVESAKGGTWNVWTWSLVAVAATGAIGYGMYEWRHELLGFGQAIATKFGKK